MYVELQKRWALPPRGTPGRSTSVRWRNSLEPGSVRGCGRRCDPALRRRRQRDTRRAKRGPIPFQVVGDSLYWGSEPALALAPAQELGDELLGQWGIVNFADGTLAGHVIFRAGRGDCLMIMGPMSWSWAASGTAGCGRGRGRAWSTGQPQPTRPGSSDCQPCGPTSASAATNSSTTSPGTAGYVVSLLRLCGWLQP